ncbi:ABC transporter ATP-binding protein [Clostridium sp. D2Q-11]|uniref:ABC transporter ATP-binding protein n=1 Tax=Anaeromonas frigoriresistens TaxID=2683708 RepID=A0A942Z5F2_9FIRM|nr:ABC transporter ATP-binding protein [Anaeromonas frigoriresistens]MBS4537366.1 ABC transporter ATP-binding protein [Anaeromonas frigoriresistens]
MKSIVLEGKSLCKTFTNGEVSANVIRNLDVEVYQGDFTVIMGTSGAGKSTLLYLLSGIDDITSGEMYLNEKRIDNLKENKMIDIRRNQIGFVFQEPNLIDDFSVYENIIITGYLGTKNRKEVHRNTDELLEKIDMIEHKNKYPSQLSGGQKQRVAIARSLINNPNIVFADEPTGALNAKQSKQALDLLSNINGSGQTILMVTHDLKAACRGNRILYIKDGKIDGELNLDQFMVDSLEEREKYIFDFIMSKGW